MTPELITAEIERQIRKLMTELDAEITPATAFDDLGMDSLTRIDLLSAAELAFDMEVPDDAVVELVKVQDLVDLVLASAAA